ncbi:hypothetical protein PAHAL_1G318000 [Panicum hallii]|jgi:hypothetical protein|uniref:Uncharacterized protein n=1 Tax=Panicum hallii TaxID=206008 RepID=A0A2T8KX01_9POAL|nr:hypothetical protein PAHAL_1G318000 [Panicum hallii]
MFILRYFFTHIFLMLQIFDLDVMTECSMEVFLLDVRTLAAPKKIIFVAQRTTVQPMGNCSHTT